MTESERRGLAHSGAVAGLCPLTEANLADGLFPLAPYRHDGGRLGIGTDANHLIDLPGELRMLEYGQRVTEHRRDGLLAEGETSVGEVLFGLAAAGGAQALAQPMGAIRQGLRCDLVELDPGHPALIGQIPATILDAWIFSTASDAVVRTVIVGGEIVIRARPSSPRARGPHPRRGRDAPATPGDRPARMTVSVDGRSLTVADVIAVARDAAPVELAPAAIEAMRRSRRVLEDEPSAGASASTACRRPRVRSSGCRLPAPTPTASTA